ncbi:MAG: hypothetical protein WBQ94_13680 [Terracidiphilus sp.]
MNIFEMDVTAMDAGLEVFEYGNSRKIGQAIDVLQMYDMAS